MASNETGWTQYERDNLACAIAESDVTDGLLKNEDIDALVDLFEAWTERRKSPSDAEQLMELRKLCLWALRDHVEVNGRCDHEPRYTEDCLQCQIRAALNPSHAQKETQ